MKNNNKDCNINHSHHKHESCQGMTHPGNNDHEDHHSHEGQPPESGHHDHMGHGGPEMAQDFLRRFWVVTVLLIPLILLTKAPLDFLGIADFFLRPYLQFIIATAIFYFSFVFFKHAKHEIQTKQYGMMTLVSLAVGAGYLFSVAATFYTPLGIEFYLEISTLIWVLLFGHYLEARSDSAAGDALQQVASLLPKKAHLIKQGQTVETALEQLKKGDVVLIKPGEKVPADGIILKGSADFNEALISGESAPVSRKRNDKVIAGSICLNGSLEVKLERLGKDSTLGQIQSLIAEAQQSKPKTQKLADRAAGWLTLIALFTALITILVWTFIIGEPLIFALTLAITVLVIACPHALGIAIPTVSTIAMSLAVKNGVFLKDLGKLEVIREVNYVVFDKTGTLTKGEFGVVEIVAFNNDKKQVLTLAASLEAHSSHTIGFSIVKYAQAKKTSLKKVAKFKNIAGKGIEGSINNHGYLVGNPGLLRQKKLWTSKLQTQYKQLIAVGKTVVVLANASKVLGMIVLADQIKPESQKAINSLHVLGVKTAMLTGDNSQVARVVAQELDIDDFFAEVLPENKYKYIKELQNKGNRVMMVGDGVNDAPALTQADVGVAIGAGTEVAVEAGDVVLTRNNPNDIPKLIILGRKTYRKMQENLVWATGYNLITIPAAAGLFAAWGIFLKPAFGALLMSLSSVIVVINALLLKKVKLSTWSCL